MRRALLAAAIVMTAAVAAFASAPAASAAIVATSTTLSLSSASVQLNEPVTMTATVRSTGVGGGAPSGNVTFRVVALDGTTTIAGTAVLSPSGSTSSQASLTTTSLSGSSYQVVAAYGGAFLKFAASKSDPVTLAVAGAVRHPTATALFADRSVVLPGDVATFTVNVTTTDGSSVVPTGLVTLTAIDDGFPTALAQANLDGGGNATLMVGGWQAGSYTVVAQYVGDQSDLSSSSRVVLSAPLGADQAPTTTSLALDAASITTNGTVHLTATVVQSQVGPTAPAGDEVSFYATASGSSQPVYLGTGKVAWTADGVNPATGVATLAISGWRTGHYTISARFGGDAYDAPSAGTAGLGVIAPATITIPAGPKSTTTPKPAKPKQPAKPKPAKHPKHAKHLKHAKHPRHR
jgi:hypothetical protein